MGFANTMMFAMYALLLLSICANTGCSHVNLDTQKSSGATKVFDPTYDWKEVLEGQEIPGGLFVRMDLASGKKWAKLISEEDPKDSHLSSGTSFIDIQAKKSIEVPARSTVENLGVRAITLAQPTTDQNDKPKKATMASSSKVSFQANTDKGAPTEHEIVENHIPEKSPIESILYSFAALPEPPNVDGLTIEEARTKMSPEKFKSEIVRLWKDRQKMLMEASESIQDQVKAMQRLIDTVNDHATPVKVAVQALHDIEWEVEDLDKAKDFHTLGGFTMIVRELNSSSLEIRAAAAWVLGSAVKNYAEAQQWACEDVAIQRLLQNIRYRDYTSPHVENMHKKSIYALSSIVRSNPCAQRLLIENNGIDAVYSLLHEEDSTQVRVKVATFVRDLIDEDIMGHKDKDSPLASIKHEITSSKWCEKLPTLLLVPNNDVRQKTLEAMIRQLPGCATTFQTQQVLELVKLVEEAWAIKDSELDVEYQQQLVGLLGDLRNHLHNKL